MEPNVSERYSALSLSREDFRRQRRDDRWEYFQKLRERILRELRETGSCSLLDEALQCHDLYLVDMLALNDVYSILLEKKPPLQYRDGISLSDGFLRKMNLSWKELSAANSKYRNIFLAVNNDTWKRWTALRNHAQQHQSRTIPIHTEPDDSTPSEELRRLQEALSAQQETNRKLNADLSDRNRELSNLKGELLAKEQAEEELRRQLQTLREQLQSEREAVLAPARQEAEDIRAAARRQGEAEAAHIREQAEADAQRLCTERRREVQDLWQAEYAKGEGERQAYTDSLLEFRQEVTSETSRFQGEVVDRLNTAVEELNRVKRELCTDLRAWQEGLYRTQHEPLAMCYVSLVRILAQGENQAMAEGEESDGLRRLRANLDRFRRSLEKAMLRLGLEVYYAQPGEFYDPARHAVAGQEEPDYESGCRVRRCTAPGVEYHSSEDEDSRTIVRAEVELEG